jgi:replication factor C subunit 1
MNVKAGFKKPGADGMGLYRAVCLSGPPGIGKTTSAHLVAKLEGYDILEYNASDTRNEKLLRVCQITIQLMIGKIGWCH